MSIYVRHEPEKTVAYQTLARCWPVVSTLYAANDEGISPYIESEVNRYLKCGILQLGYALLQCTNNDCKATRVVEFSCRGRGFCYSCGNKRMEQQSRRIESEVWPVARARQFVLTFPHQVRHWLARNPPLLSATVAAVNAEISHFYEMQTMYGAESSL
ncbi:MAG: transposase zinc-binding domain-containing protein, partial [Proteobacteria bacterium]|nr:transposase zinc-binding domain-containing protein [Pseudomonadota bacterium]